MLRDLNKNRHWRFFAGAFGQEVRTDSFALPTMNLVADGVYGQMHLFRMRLQARRNRIEPWLKLFQQRDKFFRSKFHSWRFEEKIDDFATPEKLVQFGAHIRADQFFQVLISGVVLGHGVQKFAMRRTNLVFPQKGEPNRHFFAFGAADFLFAVKLQSLQDFIDKLRRIRRHDPQGIPGFVS